MKTKYGLRPMLRIKELLEQQGLTQRDLAELMGETPQQINKWIMGVEPCLNSLGRIALVLGVKLNDIVWHAGDDVNFGPQSVVYIRGDIIEPGDTAQDVFEKLTKHYRWTEEEAAGAKIHSFNPTIGELVIACASTGSDAFVSWAKKDRDYMYRL